MCGKKFIVLSFSALSEILWLYCISISINLKKKLQSVFSKIEATLNCKSIITALVILTTLASKYQERNFVEL